MSRTCPPRFDGPLTRSPANPILVNGPDAHDVEKVGPRVVLKEGPANYRMWYEAVPAGNRSTVGYAESPDGMRWTFGAHNPVLRPNPDASAPDVGLGDSVSAYRDGDEFRVLYGGFNFNPPARRTICMATVRAG